MRRPRAIRFQKADDVPNSTLPVLLFRGVIEVEASDKAKRFRARFQENGWTGVWTDIVYDYTHFHSNAHEVLGVAAGKLTIRLGGEGGKLFRLRAGDMLVLPAGVGHRRVGPDEGLRVVGAYPRGQAHYDMKREGRAKPKVALPKTDPFYGIDGPLMQLWSRD